MKDELQHFARFLPIAVKHLADRLKIVLIEKEFGMVGPLLSFWTMIKSVRMFVKSIAYGLHFLKSAFEYCSLVGWLLFDRYG